MSNPDKSSKAQDVALTEDVIDQIESLSESGNEYFDDEEYQEAIHIWKEALALIPEPQNIFSESLWLETSIGDSYFMQGDHKNAMPHFLNSKGNIEENAYANPFIMLRIGQLYFESGDLENAKEYLLRAYLLDGIEIFEGSKEKYFEFLQKNVKLDQ
ncbi:tetratricopeptide repeat protein [uncultured Flavobacterium sp.]|uniref:tetratricopeptide repeat protein n=1 Tax=uncultured Flavobacterium sp. TaxID=165435 RepID=UPI0025EF24C7|nr:tetratricopeptide repeat protein [uncultured Flavobacterium sp.]